MTGFPFDPASSFVRDPGRYAHDAFGHVGDDDRAMRPGDVCFRTIPHTGTDISSKEPRWKNGRDNRAAQERTPVLSPVNGTIVKASTDPEAGRYHIIKADGRDEWWIGGHHSRFEKTSGHVDRGDVIARMGMSGGAKGVHVHWTVATSYPAALAYVAGWVQYRSGRTVAAWSGAAIRGRDQRLYGLTDPYPLIVREWAAAEREIAQQAAEAQAAADRAAAEATEQREDDDMFVNAKNTDTGHVYTVGKQFLRHETHGPAAERIAKLTSAGKVLELNGNDFRELLNACGIPLAAEAAVLRGKMWSPFAGVVDARTLAV